MKNERGDILAEQFCNSPEEWLSFIETIELNECFACKSIIIQNDEEMDWCEKCRKKNWWRCFECDELQKNRKYCEDIYGKTCCKDCRKGLSKDDYRFS